MKRIVKFFLLISVLIFITACSDQEASENHSKKNNQDKIDVYTTIYPLAYFTSEIGGSFVEVNSILPAGADPHTFEPTSKMMVDIAESDMFIYNGANLESYAETIKDTLQKEEVEIIKATRGLDILTHTHGLEENNNHESTQSEETHAQEDDPHNHGDVDPHVWLDPTLSMKLANTIKEALITHMPKHESVFEENYEKLSSKLTILDEKFHTTIENGKKKEILVAHAAYGYWEKAYGVEQIAITGLSSSDEPSQKEIEQILEKIKEYDINYLFFEQNVSSRLASVIQQEAGIKPLHLHNLEVLTEDELKNNETYFTIMEKNLESLEKALQ